MGNWARALFQSEDSERGAALAEWGLLVVLVAVVAILAVTLAGEEVSSMYSNIASSIDV